MSYLTECREFFGQFRQEHRNTGSILPSSRFLARALVRPLMQADGPRRIMEVGPGTGAVTGEIVKLLRPDDRFDVVEINPRFVALLQAKLTEDPAYSRVAQQVRIFTRLQEVPGAAVCDFLISGLPLNNFPLNLVLEIFGCYQRLLKPSGVLSYFEYLAIRRAEAAVCVPRREESTPAAGPVSAHADQAFPDWAAEGVSEHPPRGGPASAVCVTSVRPRSKEEQDYEED